MLKQKNTQNAKPKWKPTRNLKNCSVLTCVWVSFCTIVVHNTKLKNTSDIFPLILQTILITQMLLSTGWEEQEADFRPFYENALIDDENAF